MRTLVILMLFACKYLLFSQAVINELMPAPLSDEPEWLEMYNPGDSDLAYQNVYFSNQNSSKKISYFKVSAKSFTVLTSDTAQLLARRKLPSGSLIFKVTLPTLHNTYDPVVFRNSDSTVIDSVYYDMKWGKKGISLERRDWMVPAVDIQNISPSFSPDSATPGAINSTAIKDSDVFISAFRKKDSISIIIYNSGREVLADLILNVSADADKNGIFDSNEQVIQEKVKSLSRSDTAFYTFSISRLKETAKAPGWEQCSATVESKISGLSRTTLFDAFVSPDFGSLLINEFLFDESDSAGGEFVEIFNPTENEFTLSGFALSNALSKQGYDTIYVGKAIKLPAGGYFTLIWDTNFFSLFPELKDEETCYYYPSNMNLKKGGDRIYLSDPNGKTIDSLAYDYSWVTKDAENWKNISLEKINPASVSAIPANWLSCGDTRGATPNRPNSVSVRLSNTIALKAEPNPFSPLDEGIRDKTTISYHLPFPASRISSKIYTTEGLQVREIENNRYTAPDGTIVWDGRDDGGQNVSRGQYILLIEAVNVSGGETTNGKTVIVVGK